jgi:hypothetical protein
MSNQAVNYNKPKKKHKSHQDFKKNKHKHKGEGVWSKLSNVVSTIVSKAVDKAKYVVDPMVPVWIKGGAYSSIISTVISKLYKSNEHDWIKHFQSISGGILLNGIKYGPVCFGAAVAIFTINGIIHEILSQDIAKSSADRYHQDYRDFPPLLPNNDQYYDNDTISSITMSTGDFLP